MLISNIHCPVTVGVPLITPEGLKVSPGVSVPKVIVTVKGGVPSMVVMVNEYG